MCLVGHSYVFVGQCKESKGVLKSISQQRFVETTFKEPTRETERMKERKLQYGEQNMEQKKSSAPTSLSASQGPCFVLYGAHKH